MTFFSPRGASGSPPRATARCRAGLWNGMISSSGGELLADPGRQGDTYRGGLDRGGRPDAEHVGSHLGQARQHLLRRLAADPRCRHGQHRDLGIDHGQGPVQQIGAGERLRSDVGRLHQLEGGLASGRVRVAAGRGHQPGREAVALRQLADVGVVHDHLVGQGGQRLGRRPVAAAQPVDDQIEREQLGRVGLGRGHGALFPRQHVDLELSRLGQRGSGLVGDRQGEGTLFPGDLQRLDEVRRAA